MPSVLKKALNLLVGDPASAQLSLSMPKDHKKKHKKQVTERELIEMESKLGAKIFGDVPKGHRREFFNLDPTTWIWYEEWTDDKGKKQQATTRYELQDDRIMKVQEGARYSYIEGEERENLLAAIEQYYQQVMRNIYKVDPVTGQKLA